MPGPPPLPARQGGRPLVGLFDSGVGGLAVAHEIIRQFPHLAMAYVADQIHAPYGPRPLDDIRALAEGITRFLQELGADVVVLACNTASAAALYWLRELFPQTLFVGMEPALKPAAERTRTGRIGVLATAATFQGRPYQGVLQRYAANVEVIARVCPDFVPLVESGDISSPAALAIVEHELAELKTSGIDQLALGCTHYSFLRPLIEQVVGPDVAVIDPAPSVARQTGRVLQQLAHRPDDPTPTQPPRHSFYTTAENTERLTHAVQELLELPAPDINRLNWQEIQALC